MEAADPTTSSSKVIVQCHDPHNVFDPVVAKLESRLPLNKLYWKSPNRPLRSIDQLNVSFIRDDSKTDTNANARRHQIPGLRQTPFVKLYLARCDEKELYKETCRKDIKQWLKTQGIAQDGKSNVRGQERHDAYEHIIVHVVIPGTAAASLPKSSKHISVEASESSESVNNKSKWSSKGSSTVYDKLRADFSSSSKAPFDRVAQIRLTDPDNKSSSGLGASELEEQWQDLVEKLKTAILLSFDARVTQYEEDIREREAQQRLPGWNFCTFFILKEGLARGFESVGLMDDALAVYDELDAGLDAIVQEHTADGDFQPASALIPISNDLKPSIRSALEESSPMADAEKPSAIENSVIESLIDFEKVDFPFDLERKNYQQRILTNQASALDFHIYIFTRQMQLLLFQANLSTRSPSHVSAIQLPGIAKYDVSIVAEICEKATSFIALATRGLRRDLHIAWGGQEGLDESELEIQQRIIGGIVASWKWTAILQILSDCHITSILAEKLSIRVPDEHTVIEKADLDQSTNTNGPVDPAYEDLALWVGELLLVAIDLLRTTRLLTNASLPGRDTAKRLQSPSLDFLLRNRQEAHRISKILTIYTYLCFRYAGRLTASHRMLTSLAEIEVEDGNIDNAVRWLEHVPALSSLIPGTVTDRVLLRLYAKCLCMQGRLDDFASSLTNLLMAAAASPVARASPQYDDQTQLVLNQVIEVSGQISPMQLPLTAFFIVQALPKIISHENGSTSFTLSIPLALRLNTSVEVPSIELLLSSIDGFGPPEITMNTAESVALDATTQCIRLVAGIITEGWYDLTKLTITVGKIKFVHNFRSMPGEDDMATPATLTSPSPLKIYPHCGSLAITADTSSEIDLTQMGQLRFALDVGDDDLDHCTLHFRPATAGLRLDIQNARISPTELSQDVDIHDAANVNVLTLPFLAHAALVYIDIPYSTETSLTAAIVNVEVACQADATPFSAFFRCVVDTSLPLSVSAQDIVQTERIFSCFTATASTVVPVRIKKWVIDNDGETIIKSGRHIDEDMDVFQKMPASWVVEVAADTHPSSTNSKFPLALKYQSYADIISENVRARFKLDCSKSQVNFAHRLLSSHLMSRILVQWNQLDLEAAVLLRKFDLLSYEATDWGSVLHALNPEARANARDWLRSWHHQNQQLDLNLSLGRVCTLKLMVEILNASLILTTSLETPMIQKQYLALGEMITGKLSIDCICRADVKATIHFDVVCHPDIWLIGGKKRGMIEAVTKKHIFDIILIPQKTGNLLLPSIEIKCRSTLYRIDIQDIPFEVENKSQAKSVLVVPDLRATTIAIGTEDSAGRHWLVDSRSR